MRRDWVKPTSLRAALTACRFKLCASYVLTTCLASIEQALLVYCKKVRFISAPAEIR